MGVCWVDIAKLWHVLRKSWLRAGGRPKGSSGKGSHFRGLNDTERNDIDNCARVQWL